MHETEAERLQREQREREATLKYYFNLRDELAHKLKEVDDQIALTGREYWKAEGNIVPPRIERLRRVVLGENL